MPSPRTALATAAPEQRSFWGWIGPLTALLVFAVVGIILHHQLAQLHIKSVFAHLHAIPRRQILAALLFTALSYWLLTTYEVLALRYLRRVIPYTRIVFTSFIAYSFGHTLGFAVFTGSAIRFRLYVTAGVSAIDVATVTAFCSLSLGIGLATISGLSLLLTPAHAATALHLHHNWSLLVGAVLLCAAAAYAGWACFARRPFEIRGWALRPPGPAIGLAQIGLSVLDLSLSSAVLWSLLPVSAHVPFITFLGVYAAAVIAGIISHVPGGVGVFEAVVLLTVPNVAPEAMLGSLLAYRAIYYLVPLVVGTLLFGSKELAAQSRRFAWAQQLASAYIGPVVPQIAGALTFLAGALLLFSGATPAVDERLAFLDQFLPLAVLEISHLAGSIVGLGLLVLARALFRRVQAAYHISVWLLVAGIIASLLKGLDFEEATLLALVLGVLMLGRRAFYRPTAIRAERFTPAWVVSITGVIVMAVWLGLISYRHVAYSELDWWTFALDANAPRMLRASLRGHRAGQRLHAAGTCCGRRAPSRPWPGHRSSSAPARSIERADLTVANAALTGDKRLLFSDAGDALRHVPDRRPQLDCARGTRSARRPAAEELVWRLREISDHHGGQTVFYQVCADRLALYVDLGLAALKIGEEARVAARRISPSRAPRARTCGNRTGARSAMAPRSRWCRLRRWMRCCPRSERISHRVARRVSRPARNASPSGPLRPEYVRQFPVAVVYSQGTPAAFANLWITGTKSELSVDLMRFGPDAPRGAMDYLFIELMLWGQREGYRWFNLGMAPLSGLEAHPLAPAWHRVGEFHLPPRRAFL